MQRSDFLLASLVPSQVKFHDLELFDLRFFLEIEDSSTSEFKGLKNFFSLPFLIFNSVASWKKFSSLPFLILKSTIFLKNTIVREIAKLNVQKPLKLLPKSQE